MPKPPATVKALIFDMGRVLIGIDFAQLARRFPDVFFDVGEIIRFSAADDPAFTAFNRGEIAPGDFHRHVCGRFGRELSFADFRAVWTGIFVPLAGMQELVEELRRGGRYRLGLLSDTDPLHWEYISMAFPWIPACFPRPTLSFRERLCKPEPEIFRRAAAAVECAPEECLFIDDREDNVAGARAVGMAATRFVGVAELRRFLQTLPAPRDAAPGADGNAATHAAGNANDSTAPGEPD